jgi:uncharacterized protein YcbX
VPTTLGTIQSLFRHPVKSMKAQRPTTLELSWHGVAGDRRFALRRVSVRGDFPYLTASKFPELLLYEPFGGGTSSPEGPATHVRTPAGAEFELMDPALDQELSRRSGHEIQMMHHRHGIFDDGCVSILAASTLRAIEQEAGRELDVRRFRPNIVVHTESSRPFGEDEWLGRVLEFGGQNGPKIHITSRDERCAMINLDPETARTDPQLMKIVTRLNQNCAGVYGVVVGTGTLAVGQPVQMVD